VQGLPSLHGALLFVCWQPVSGAHESSVQRLPSSQLIAAPVQTPPLHASPVVHTEPSLQGPGAGVPGWQLPPPQ
jgi:hypothetical protein